VCIIWNHFWYRCTNYEKEISIRTSLGGWNLLFGGIFQLVQFQNRLGKCKKKKKKKKKRKKIFKKKKKKKKKNSEYIFIVSRNDPRYATWPPFCVVSHNCILVVDVKNYFRYEKYKCFIRKQFKFNKFNSIKVKPNQ